MSITASAVSLNVGDPAASAAFADATSVSSGVRGGRPRAPAQAHEREVLSPHAGVGRFAPLAPARVARGDGRSPATGANGAPRKPGGPSCPPSRWTVGSPGCSPRCCLRSALPPHPRRSRRRATSRDLRAHPEKDHPRQLAPGRPPGGTRTTPSRESAGISAGSASPDAHPRQDEQWEHDYNDDDHRPHGREPNPFETGHRAILRWLQRTRRRPAMSAVCTDGGGSSGALRVVVHRRARESGEASEFELGRRLPPPDARSGRLAAATRAPASARPLRGRSAGASRSGSARARLGPGGRGFKSCLPDSQKLCKRAAFGDGSLAGVGDKWGTMSSRSPVWRVLVWLCYAKCDRRASSVHVTPTNHLDERVAPSVRNLRVLKPA